MRTILHVISDLHLGGAPGDEASPGFQICRPPAQALLAKFIDRLPRPTRDEDVRLIIAGDIVDFLAEEPFEAFTRNPAVARRKLERIVAHTAPVWTALAAFVGRGGALTLLLGNHDIELSLPGPREFLLDKLGPGRVDFVHDNAAFTFGPVLIEHGNRFDAWNAVPHDGLRRVRSQLSRRLPVDPPFDAMPGSRLVVDVMNDLKRDYPFIDLLKPEAAGALPIAAALGAGGWRDAWKFSQRYRQQRQRDYDEEGEPDDPGLIAYSRDSDQAMFDLAEDIASGGDAQAISAAGRTARRDGLFKAFRGVWRNKHREAFALGHEEEEYLRPVRRAADAGFSVIVYGHTHLAKRVPLAEDPKALPVYLNTGTWADLMRVPRAIWSWEEQGAKRAFDTFLDDLLASRLERWRRLVPTYARIVVEGDKVSAADLHFGDDDQVVTADALSERLQGDSDA